MSRLPRASHFRQAQADDEEWAEQVIDLPDPPESAPGLAEFTPERELLMVIVELLQSANSNIRVLAHDKNPPRVRPLPRPRTALDRVKDRRRMERFDALQAEVAEAQRRHGGA